jgi:hypothetical protein
MRAIYKFPLRTTDHQEIYLPVGAEILTVQIQHGVPCLWALVEGDDPVTKHGITIVGTGHPVADVGTYLGTYQLNSGAMVFHVFNSAED